MRRVEAQETAAYRRALDIDGEGMLLYDMDVRGLGTLRVAEHFTVENGKIIRIRQVHDTATLRAAGFVR